MKTYPFKAYWQWYRILYFLYWLGVSLFYGSRAVQTVQYWQRLAQWQVSPGRLYLLLTGILLCCLGITTAGLFFLKRDGAVRWVTGLSSVYFLWQWLDQLWITGSSDILPAVFWLGLGTLGYALWTILVFRKEIFHDKVR